MNQLTFSAVLFGTACPQIISAAPAKRASRPAAKPALTMPAEVRALKVPGAKTLYFGRHAVGVRGAPVLLHAWKAERRSSTTPLDTEVPSPVCVDFFSKSAAPRSKWELVATTSYLDGDGGWQGIQYATHWMEPKTKQGLIIEQTSSSQGGYCIRLFTLPQGVATEALDEFGHPVYVQEFRGSHGNGGLTITSTSLKRNPRGQITVEEKITVKADVPDTHNTYGWNGYRWVQVATREQPRR